MRKFVLAFFDDILVYSRTWEDQLCHLRKVFLVLRRNCLFAKSSKCKFGYNQVDYTGHVISENAIIVEPKKASMVESWLPATNTKALREFLGLTGYYRKVIKGYGELATPLNRMLKKGEFQWCEESQTAFERLKQAILSLPVLRMPNFGQDFVIEGDASGVGVDMVLMQEDHPKPIGVSPLRKRHCCSQRIRRR